MPTQQQDEVIAEQAIQKTSNYDKFKTIVGNRPIDEGHVVRLANKMEREGNRMPDDPAIVNEKLEVIDGQHRLEACKLKGYPFYYIIRPGLNVESVKVKNTGQRNWTWLNYAQHFAARGNVNYQQFLMLYEDFGEKYGVLLFYASAGNTARTKQDGKGRAFVEGDFIMEDYEFTHKMLGQYQELAGAANHSTREFATAAYRFMRTPAYEHERMIEQIKKFGEPLLRCFIINDYMFALEEIWRKR